LLLLFGWIKIRSWAQGRVPAPDPALAELAKNVRIMRDEWGVPHIFGRRDADTAFGLAYAHAEDDFATIEESLLMARGVWSLKILSPKAVISDYYALLFGIREEADAQYETQLSKETRSLLDGYAKGLTYYAELHPDEVDGRFLPYTGKDVAMGFAYRIPMFEGLLQQTLALYGRKFNPEDVAFDFPGRTSYLTGSNTHAVAPSRSADHTTRLNINSHQPWSGSVAWYEAHLVSEEGWNMTGGTFPGAPMILHGHNDFLGWAHTVNAPDLVDIYQLDVPEGDDSHYIVDGEKLEFRVRRIPLEINLKLFTIPIPLSFRESIFGPVIEAGGKTYALRAAGRGRLMRSAEQWYRMNKARNFAEWKGAMRIQGIPMFHTVYADRTNIFYVHNGLMPLRREGPDWLKIVPGNTRKNLWDTYLPFDRLPAVENPPSGFVQNCNSSPFHTTTGPGNPDPRKFSSTFGISERMTNRSLRSLELFGSDTSITADEFFRYKFDRTYTRRGPLYSEALDPLFKNFQPDNEDERKGLELLRAWDGRTDENSKAAALAILTWKPIMTAVEIQRDPNPPLPADTYRDAVRWLMRNYGRLNVPLGEVQRLRRGDVDLPVGGGPDILNALYGKEDGDKQVGWAGDCFVLIVEFGPTVRSWSLHQYGSSNRPDSPHYSDQTSLFTHRTMKRTLRTPAEIRERLFLEYHPGEETRN